MPSVGSAAGASPALFVAFKDGDIRSGYALFWSDHHIWRRFDYAHAHNMSRNKLTPQANKGPELLKWLSPLPPPP